MLADLLAQPGLGPDVERVQADPHPGTGSDQERVVERVDERQVGVQPAGRLDGEGHPAVGRVADQFAGRVHVGVRAGIPAGRTAPPDQPVHHRGAHRRRQVDVLLRAPQRRNGRLPRRQVEAERAGRGDDLDPVPAPGRDDRPGPGRAGLGPGDRRVARAEAGDRLDRVGGRQLGKAQPADADPWVHGSHLPSFGLFFGFVWTARCSRAGDRQPLTMRMASCTSRGSCGCIRAIDSFTGRPSFIARLSSNPVTPASLYLVSASNQPSSGTGRPSASS